jgi:hypothetical protein
MSKFALIVLNSAALVFLASVTANASWRADCINPGVCSTIICVAIRERALSQCQLKCGRLARIRSVRTSNCTPH